MTFFAIKIMRIWKVRNIIKNIIKIIKNIYKISLLKKKNYNFFKNKKLSNKK